MSLSWEADYYEMLGEAADAAFKLLSEDMSEDLCLIYLPEDGERWGELAWARERFRPGPGSSWIATDLRVTGSMTRDRMLCLLKDATGMLPILGRFERKLLTSP